MPCRITPTGYLDTRGLSVLVFNNFYDPGLSDSKSSGVEIIHHGIRTATNGDVRLSPTPEQWDPSPRLIRREVQEAEGRIEVSLEYPEKNFSYRVRVQAEPDCVTISIILDAPLPEDLADRAGFNLEFLPSAYFGKTFMADGAGGVFPLHPGGPMARDASGRLQPLPLAAGAAFILAPEDPHKRISIRAREGRLMLFDGRNQAQNGWFVLRSGLPAGRTGSVVEWRLEANTVEGWMRKPVIGHCQAGYHPRRAKTAVIELDPADTPRKTARVLRITEDGTFAESFQGETREWGAYLRYKYLTFDFTPVTADGLYVLEYGDARTAPFRIAPDVLAEAWHPTLDVYFPVQMDHMRVTEGYRVWHGVPHMDDALQAPVDHAHFDMYAQGPTTDTPYKGGEHIPGLNVGGWFDAGDFDIRTQTVSYCVRMLSLAWEEFGLSRDQTAVDQAARSVVIRSPDGKPDILQQIEHGVLQLLAQYDSVGHAICGIIEPTLSQYTHIGDAASKTDNRVTEGPGSDDRWAFTGRSTALDYGSAAALAAASRALRGYDKDVADKCLSIALGVWKDEHEREPSLFRHGNTTGGLLPLEELCAAVELLICTAEPAYADRVSELLAGLGDKPELAAMEAARAAPFLAGARAATVKATVSAWLEKTRLLSMENPYGVPIMRGSWAGSIVVLHYAVSTYYLRKAFPNAVDAEPIFRAADFILGCHPDSDISLVSGVGTVSKKVAYGSNRADFTFIPGGVVPGIRILEPDFPENKEDWPFLWGENEYVVSEGAAYIFAVNAAHGILKEI